MAKRRKLITRRRTKWAGVAGAGLAAVFALLFAYTSVSRFGFSYYDEERSTLSTIEVSRGRLGFTRIDPSSFSPPWVGETKFWSRHNEPFHLKLMPSFDWEAGQGGIFIPLWVFFILVAAPAAWLWRSDRRALAAVQ